MNNTYVKPFENKGHLPNQNYYITSIVNQPYIQLKPKQQLAPWYKDNMNITTTKNHNVFEPFKSIKANQNDFPARQYPLYFQK